MSREPSPSKPRVTRELALILLLALAVRLLRILLITDVVEIEGSEYGRIAQNLAQEGSYVGLVEGPELMLPPLYPFAIVAVAAVTGDDVVLAGRIVSCIASLLTVFACWLLARRTAGPRAARWTGILVALIPGCVLTGAAVFSEGLLMAWLAFGLLAFERAATTRRVVAAVACGAAFGLAYLSRIESVLIAPVAILLLATGWPRRDAPRRACWPAALACLVAFLAVALPYPLWVKEVTGQTTFAGKSARVFATIERFSQDMTFEEASYALADDGTPVGPWLAPNAPWDGPGPLEIVADHPQPILFYVLGNIRRAAVILLTGKGIISIIWLWPLWLAWRGRSKDRPRGARALDLLLIWMFLHVVAMACVYKVLIRYLVPLAIPAALWAGRAIADEYGDNTRRPWVIIAVLLLTSSRGFVSGHGEFDESHADENAAIHTLADAIRPHAGKDTIVLADDSRIPFHAGTWWLPTPQTTDGDSLLAYARAHHADLLAISVKNGEIRRPGPWVAPLLDNPGMTRLFMTGDGRYLLYRID